METVIVKVIAKAGIMSRGAFRCVLQELIQEKATEIGYCEDKGLLSSKFKIRLVGSRDTLQAFVSAISNTGIADIEGFEITKLL